jgi:hypothetical protein
VYHQLRVELVFSIGVREMDLRKFHTNLFVDDSNESNEWEWIADLSDEAEFLENLRYWQIVR